MHSTAKQNGTSRLTAGILAFAVLMAAISFAVHAAEHPFEEEHQHDCSVCLQLDRTSDGFAVLDGPADLGPEHDDCYHSPNITFESQPSIRQSARSPPKG